MPVDYSHFRRHAPLGALLLVLCVLAPSYWTALNTPATGVYHDDSLYLITARALAEGRGYTIESTPAPMPQTKYPILFPALLAIVWKISPVFPSNVILFKSISLIATLIWLSLSYLLIRRESGNPTLAAIAIAFTAASPQVIFLSTAALSETTFAAISTACLLLLCRHDRTGSRTSLLGAAVLAAAAYHTRTIGFCLILAGCAALWFRGKQRETLLFASVCAILAAPWILWQSLHRTVADPYLSQQNYYSAYNIVFSFAWLDKLRIALTNLLLIPFSVQTLFNLSWGGAIGLIALPFGIRALFKSEFAPPVRAFLIFSGTVIVLWVWPPLRFLIPLLPLLFWAIWIAAPPRWHIPILAVTAFLIVQGIWSSNQFSATAAQSGLWYPQQTTPQDWKSFEQQLAWIRANTPSDAILQSNVDPTIFLYTGRRAIRGSHGNVHLFSYLEHAQPLGNETQYAQTLSRNQVSFLIDTPWGWFLENRFFPRLIDDLNRSNPTSLNLDYQSTDPKFRIFRLTSPQSLQPDLK